MPVVVLDHLTPTQRRAYILADNQLTLQGGWNEELLASELAELSAAGFDLALTGFSDDELADLLGDADPDDETNPPMGGFTEDADEDIPQAPTNPISRAGDIWQLGAHRLICGDSARYVTLRNSPRASARITPPTDWIATPYLRVSAVSSAMNWS